VYKRARTVDTGAVTGFTPLLVPDALRPVVTDPQRLAAHRTSLADAERAFASEAQHIGLGAAFAKFGSPDAVNMGANTRAIYVRGAASIAELVGSGTPANASPVNWGPDTVLVASSGDLGITIGFIRSNAPPAGAPPSNGSPFFTIWRRASPGAPWRYVAE
jgi:hypothetical protein